MVFDLVGDYAAALQSMPADHPRRQVLALIDEAIRRDAQFLASHPATMFQCMWNACWWYDSPEAAKHYEVPKGAPLGPWDQPGPKLYQLLETWRSSKGAQLVRWIRTLRPPPLPLGSDLLAVLPIGQFQRDMAISPDGNLIASGQYREICLWDFTTGLQSWIKLPEGAFVESVAFSPNGALFAVATDKVIRIYDLETCSERLCLTGHDAKVRAVTFTHSGAQLISGSEDTTVRFWNLETGAEVRRFLGHEAGVACVACSPDESLLAIGSARIQNSLRLHRCEGMAPLQICKLNESEGDSNERRQIWPTRSGLTGDLEIRDIAFSADGKYIGAAKPDGAEVWDVVSGETIIKNAAFGYRCITFSLDGSLCASGHGRNVEVTNLSTRKEMRSDVSHDDDVTFVAFLPDGRLVSASEDCTIRVWKEPTENSPLQRPRLEAPKRNANDLTFAADGRLLLFSAMKGVGAVNVASGEVQYTLTREDIRTIAAFPQGPFILANVYELGILLGNSEFFGEWIQLCIGSFEWMCASPDGKCMAYCRDKGDEICLVSIEDLVNSYFAVRPQLRHKQSHFRVEGPSASSELNPAKDLNRIKSHCLQTPRPVEHYFAFSPDSTYCIYAASDNELRLIDLRSRAELRSIAVPDSGASSIRFSWDGSYIVIQLAVGATAAGAELLLVDTRDWSLEQVVQDPATLVSPPGSVAPNPASVSTHFLDARTHQVIATFPVHLGGLCAHPSGEIWAGSNGNQIFILALEAN